MAGIASIEMWLRGLQQAGGAIRQAGLASGTNQARGDGFAARQEQDKVSVNYRGQRSMANVPDAIGKGMTQEFERRAQ